MDPQTQKLLDRLRRWVNFYKAKSARASSQFGGVQRNSIAVSLNRACLALETGKVTADYITYKYVTESASEPPVLKVSTTRQFEPGNSTIINACVTITVESTETGFKGKAVWKITTGSCSVDLEISQTQFKCAEVQVDPSKRLNMTRFSVVANARELGYLEKLFRRAVADIE